jgi:hypothetical protein
MTTLFAAGWIARAACRPAVCILVAATIIGCTDRHTGSLTPGQEQRFTAEGIARRADDVDFRYTANPGGRSERRENRRASIVVTRSSVLIHKNEKVGVEITPLTRRDVSVERAGQRIRIHSGRGRSEEVWSFEPPSDAPGWTTDIRSVINGSKSAANR